MESHHRRPNSVAERADVGGTDPGYCERGKPLRHGSEHLHAAGGREIPDCGDDGGRHHADQASGNHLDRILLSLGFTKRPFYEATQ